MADDFIDKITDLLGNVFNFKDNSGDESSHTHRIIHVTGLQDELNNVVHKTGSESIAGSKTFTAEPKVKTASGESAFVATNSDGSCSIMMGVGASENRTGLYEKTSGRSGWLVLFDENDNFLLPKLANTGSATQSVYVDSNGKVVACSGSSLAAASNQNITPTKAQLEANQYFIYRNNNGSSYNLNIDADLLVNGKVYSITLVGDSSVTPARTWKVRLKSSGGVAQNCSDYANYSVSSTKLSTSYIDVETNTTWRNKQVVRKGSSVYIFGY